ncbi:MAG: helix-turn-helix transcriptional regulator [Thermodesulfobacteriota bacterium]|nr:helix-turn-helix transcriptional regulator [Thermodesulfobacteriota bacterium]
MAKLRAVGQKPVSLPLEKKGRPTYVAVWEVVDKKIRLVEVSYVGTHEKAPIELKFLGPSTNKTKAIKALKSFGFVNISDTVPWRDLFPEYADEELAGVCLAGSRHKEKITQKQLSELTGIPQSYISEMENGKRAIG